MSSKLISNEHFIKYVFNDETWQKVILASLFTTFILIILSETWCKQAYFALSQLFNKLADSEYENGYK